MEPQPSDGHPGKGRQLYWAAMVALLLGMTALYQATVRNDGGMSLHQDAQGRLITVLNRKRNGHFQADGEINGHAVSFLIDTGATDVAVSVDLARSIGLEFGPRVVLMTAAGPAEGWMSRLDSVKVGTVALRDVRATITAGLGDEALLGMSFLKHFSLVQDGDTLVITGPGQEAP